MEIAHLKKKKILGTVVAGIFVIFCVFAGLHFAGNKAPDERVSYAYRFNKNEAEIAITWVMAMSTISTNSVIDLESVARRLFGHIEVGLLISSPGQPPVFLSFQHCTERQQQLIIKALK